MAGPVIGAAPNVLSERSQSKGVASNVLSERSESKGTMYCVYILRCSDGSFYVGHTDNLPARLQAHNDGRASVWTARRRLVTLLLREAWPDEQSAMARENQLKHWTRAKKEALIAGNPVLLHRLSRRSRR